MSCLALDAMGVIFKSADDVGELLIPFIAEKCGSTDAEAIQSAYLAASLGKIHADEFWNRVDVSSDSEDEFLSRHGLNDGVTELLSLARRKSIPIWCLSNDVGRWSLKLRKSLGIEKFLTGAVISGDVGMRKPDEKIYHALMHSSGYQGENILFVDDRNANVIAAREAGLEAVRYDPLRGFTDVENWISRSAP